MGRPPLFTKAQVLHAIEASFVEQGFAPTVAELRERLGGGSAGTIVRYLRDLERDGEIERWPGARGIRLTRRTEASHRTRLVPVVGEVAAGSLAFAEERVDAWVRLPQTLVPSHVEFFLLRARGDSMNRSSLPGGNIESGDLLLVERRASAQSGDIVIALVDDEATVKRFERGNDYCVLRPMSTNPVHRPIVLESDIILQGIVRRVMKDGVVRLGIGEEPGTVTDE